jgi:hypothetical protein
MGIHSASGEGLEQLHGKSEKGNQEHVCERPGESQAHYRNSLYRDLTQS